MYVIPLIPTQIPVWFFFTFAWKKKKPLGYRKLSD